MKKSSEGVLLLAGSFLIASQIQASELDGSPCIGLGGYYQQRKIISEKPATLKDMSWTILHSYYSEHLKRYPQCDDGIYAEGHSSFVITLLSRKWESLEDLLHITESDKPFYKFVIKHIDATADRSDLDAIVENSGQNCPKKARSICANIKRAAERAIKDN